ncbi:MAG: restriction endonuclease [Nitrospirae bacterium]|nr:restriction endonuclease [Nitrospirota bacterium]
MAADGKHLEALVAYVEKTLLPEGFAVTTNERIFNDEGIQIAEFDIEIRGKVGSTAIAWLIECRDRPSSGPASNSWIEQLVGRRTRFGFNKVTAVSTTGFATGATEFALAQGIELREVKALSPEEFADWLKIRHIHNVERHTMLENASLLIDESEPKDRQRALAELLSKTEGSAAFLKSSKSGNTTTLANAFSSAAGKIEGLFDDLVANGPEKKICLRANYIDDDHFVVETTEGLVRVRTIIFDGEVRLKETLIPLMGISEYRHAKTGEVISQFASFAPQSIHGMKFSTEMHKIGDTGETHVILRRLPDNA